MSRLEQGRLAGWLGVHGLDLEVVHDDCRRVLAPVPPRVLVEYHITTTKGTGGKTPYELWNGAAPSVHHLRTFECVAHVKIVGPRLKKLDDRSKSMVFIGYEPGSKAYHVYDPTILTCATQPNVRR